MTTVATLWVELGLDSSKYHKGLTDATNSTSGLGGIMQSVGNIAGTVLKAGLLAGAAGAVALGKGLFDSVEAAVEAQDVQAQLNAVLESTGGIAGVTADEVNRLADTLSGVTKFEDEAIISGENLLLTFTNIGKDIFPQATEVMLDMSQALGQDLKSSAIQLGKALQDPVLGVTALRRVGVNFNEEQQKMIKAMVEAGDVAGAQAFILRELQTEFGGSARAAGETFGGQLEILKNKLGNIKEAIGAALLPVLTDLAKQFNEFLSDPAFQMRLNAFISWIQDEAIPWLTEKLIPAIGEVVTWFTDVFIPKVGEWTDKINEFFKNVGIGIENFKAENQTELTAINTHWSETVESLKGTWAAFIDLLGLSEVNFGRLGDVGTTALQLIDITLFGANIALGWITEKLERLKELFDTMEAPPWLSLINPLLGLNLELGGLPPLGDLGFAGGGIVPGALGAPVLATVHGGETITPAGQSDQKSVMSDRQLALFAKFIAMEISKATG